MEEDGTESADVEPGQDPFRTGNADLDLLVIHNMAPPSGLVFCGFSVVPSDFFKITDKVCHGGAIDVLAT